MAKTTKKATPKKKVANKSIQDMSPTELQQHRKTLQTELSQSYRSHAARELTNTARLSELRREIARTHTVAYAHQAKENA